MKFQQLFLLITVFITGAAILVVEILGARTISPYFGASLYVWTSLIAVTLISLAIGYRQGGVLADKAAESGRLYKIILQSALFLTLIPFFKNLVLIKMGVLGIRAGALLSSFVIFSIPLGLLGMATPFAIRISIQRLQSVGATTGDFYAAGTVGSFLGALLAGFVLVPRFSVDNVFFFTAMVLSLPPFFYFLLSRKTLTTLLSLAVIIFSLASFTVFTTRTEANPFVVFKSTSLYGEVRVIDGPNNRSLLIDGITQGNMDTAGQPTDMYPYVLDSLIFSLRPKVSSALVLGLGMGACPKLLKERGVLVDVVEIDPSIVSAARRHFGYTEGRGTLYLGDARRFVETTSNTYDYILLDAYTSERLPYHLLSKEAFGSIAKTLNPNGILAINFHGFVDPAKARASYSIYKTLKKVFKNVVAFEVQQWNNGEMRNLVFFASQGILKADAPLRAGTLFANSPDDASISMEGPISMKGPISMEGSRTGIVLTDDYNPIEILHNPIAEATRTNSLKAYSAAVLLD